MLGGGISLATFATSDVALAEDNSVKMPFRILGNTGLAVSVLGFGFWASLGSKSDELDKDKTVAKAKTILNAARTAGM